MVLYLYQIATHIGKATTLNYQSIEHPHSLYSLRIVMRIVICYLLQSRKNATTCDLTAKLCLQRVL
uniref:Uncharacterized protein n=1 Tax=Arundo donax TaxID=35708 RepID=A0A0A9FIM7_ARUDO